MTFRETAEKVAEAKDGELERVLSINASLRDEITVLQSHQVHSFQSRQELQLLVKCQAGQKTDMAMQLVLFLAANIYSYQEVCINVLILMSYYHTRDIQKRVLSSCIIRMVLPDCQAATCREWWLMEIQRRF